MYLQILRWMTILFTPVRMIQAARRLKQMYSSFACFTRAAVMTHNKELAFFLALGYLIAEWILTRRQTIREKSSQPRSARLSHWTLLILGEGVSALFIGSQFFNAVPDSGAVRAGLVAVILLLLLLFRYTYESLLDSYGAYCVSSADLTLGGRRVRSVDFDIVSCLPEALTILVKNSGQDVLCALYSADNIRIRPLGRVGNTRIIVMVLPAGSYSLRFKVAGKGRAKTHIAVWIDPAAQLTELSNLRALA